MPDVPRWTFSEAATVTAAVLLGATELYLGIRDFHWWRVLVVAIWVVAGWGTLARRRERRGLGIWQPPRLLPGDELMESTLVRRDGTEEHFVAHVRRAREGTYVRPYSRPVEFGDGDHVRIGAWPKP